MAASSSGPSSDGGRQRDASASRTVWHGAKSYSATSTLPPGTPGVGVKEEGVKKGAGAAEGAAAEAASFRVRSFAVADGVECVQEWVQGRSRFELEYGLDHGSTDNTYVVRGADGVALFDVPDQQFTSSFLAALSDSVRVRDVTHLVLGHFSPRRGASLIELLLARRAISAGPLRVFCSGPTAVELRSLLAEGDFVGKGEVELAVVRRGDTLDLGGGRLLTFVPTPTPRWPDALVAYDTLSGCLFASKLFSAHVASLSEVVDDSAGPGAFASDWEHFFDCVVASAARPVSLHLARLNINSRDDVGSGAPTEPTDIDDLRDGSALGLSVLHLCPMHGPCVRGRAVTYLVQDYQRWCKEKLALLENLDVLIIYASAYGNTGLLADAIAAGVSAAGIGVELLNCEFASPAEVSAAVRRCHGIAIGSPTLGGHVPTPVKSAMGVLLRDPEAKSKPAGCFGSFGWSGEAVDILDKGLADAGFKVAFAPLRVKFTPDVDALGMAEQAGRDLAEAVKKSERVKRETLRVRPKTYEAASELEQAVGRIATSVTVLTARDPDGGRLGVLASWVSQATFNPPGVTVAINKGQPVSSQLLNGVRFVINVLGNNVEKEYSTHFARTFAPAEDRLMGLPNLSVSELSGCTLLGEASAYLECTVMQRVEAGDHWVLYATVQEGKVQDPQAVTSVRLRKSGREY